MVAGVRTNDLELVAQSYATLHERLFQLLDLLKVATRYTRAAPGSRRGLVPLAPRTSSQR